MHQELSITQQSFINTCLSKDDRQIKKCCLRSFQ